LTRNVKKVYSINNVGLPHQNQEFDQLNDTSTISEILSTRVPEILYHYTNSSGLIGIVTSKQIWVTKIHYLNDKSELQLAFDYIRKEIHSQLEISNSKQADEELNGKLEALDSIQLVNIGVASFTEEGDQLSQWRGYCEIGNGYSLGFKGSALLKQAERANYHLVPCVYAKQIHQKIVRELVRSTSVYNIKQNPNYNKPPFYAKSFADAVLFIAPIIKAESFKEEKEWRLISDPLRYDNADYRSGTHSMIPYWKFNIDLAEILKSIIIGPTAEPDLSFDALRGLLNKELTPYGSEISNEVIGNITHSNIPYRKI